MKTGTQDSINLARRLLNLEESRRQKEVAGELDEAGTPTTALPPSTDATRQLAKDQATSGQPAIAPVGATPSLQNPAQMAAPVDDEPVHDQPGPGHDTGYGITVPQDRRATPGGPEPASDTMSAEKDPGSDTSRQAQDDIKKAMVRDPIPRLRVESMDTMDEIVEFLIEAFGGPEDLAWQLYTDGAPYELAKAITEGEVDYEEADERILEFLIEMAMAVEAELDQIEESEEALTEAEEIVEALYALDEEGLYALAEALVSEGLGKALLTKAAKIHSTLKKKPSELGGPKKVKIDTSKKTPSTQAGKLAKAKSVASKSGVSYIKGDKPAAAWSSTKNDGHDARRNK